MQKPQEDKAILPQSNDTVMAGFRSFRCPHGYKDENQDNYLIIESDGIAHYLIDEKPTTKQLSRWPSNVRRYAVIDGVGRAVNARQVAEQIAQELAVMPALLSSQALYQYLDDLHLRLRNTWLSEGKLPGATLILLEITDNTAQLFHVGDSRLYEVTDNRITCLTIDHTPPTQLLLGGMSSQEQWTHQVYEEQSSGISQAYVMGGTLGNGHEMSRELTAELYPLDDDILPEFLKGMGDRRTIHLQPDRLYLLVTDGFWHLTYPQKFIDTWPKFYKAKPQDFVDSLASEWVDTTYGSLSTDNATAIAFTFNHLINE